MNRLTILAIFVGITVSALGQQAKPAFEFDKKIHDFGEIKEDGGKVAHKFVFTNTGGQPLIVHNVKASCGCTSPDWTRKPIQPGKDGFVNAVFDPNRRPGNFNKSIVVTTNGTDPTVVLRITGKVIDREKTVEDIYPREMGAIRLKAAHISFTRIAPTEVKSEELEIINTSDNPVRIEFEGVPDHVSIATQPKELAPGAEGKIVATYDAEKIDDWGFVVDRVYLKMNGESDRRNRLSVSATIEEDYSKWSDEKMANAPVIGVDERVFDFGEIKQGEKVKHNFKITNKGESDLILHKIRASCGCTAIEPEKTVISPGETTQIGAVLNSRGKSGRQNLAVTIYSNDPKSSTLLLRLTGTVNQ